MLPVDDISPHCIGTIASRYQGNEISNLAGPYKNASNGTWKRHCNVAQISRTVDTHSQWIRNTSRSSDVRTKNAGCNATERTRWVILGFNIGWAPEQLEISMKMNKKENISSKYEK